MPATTPFEIAIFALVAVFVIYRQLAPRPVQGTGRLFLLPVILAGYGAYSMLKAPPSAGTTYLLTAGELAISALAGLVRGLTIRFWTDRNGVLMRRGTWLTVAVWVAFIALRVGGFALLHGALGTPELMRSFGVTLLVQAAVTYFRGQGLLQGAGISQSPEGLYR
jgi:hypothetical protein